MLNKEEIEKAKEELNNYIIIINKTKDTEYEWHGYYNNELHELKRDIETLLQYIDQLEKENKALKKGQTSLMFSRKKWKGRYYKLRKMFNKQSKIIDEMANFILDADYEKNKNSNKDYYIRCKEEVKQYFEKKVEGK